MEAIKKPRGLGSDLGRGGQWRQNFAAEVPLEVSSLIDKRQTFSCKYPSPYSHIPLISTEPQSIYHSILRIQTLPLSPHRDLCHNATNTLLAQPQSPTGRLRRHRRHPPRIQQQDERRRERITRGQKASRGPVAHLPDFPPTSVSLNPSLLIPH